MSTAVRSVATGAVSAREAAKDTLGSIRRNSVAMEKNAFLNCERILL